MMLYPTILPIDDVQLIIDTVRGGSTNFDRAKFGKAIWELSGYALKMTLGETGAVAAPKSDHNFFGSTAPLTDEEVADLLSTVVSPYPTAAPIPWLAILKRALTALAAAL